MKLHLIFVLFLAGLLFSCENTSTTDEPTDQQTLLQSREIVNSMFKHQKAWNAGNAAKSENATRVEKKFKIRTSGTMQMVACDFGENFGKTIVEGTGNATHLGKFTIELSYCFNDQGPVENIFATQTAANGDELYSVVIGSDPEAHSLDFLIYGGTGRFEDATGFITLIFDFDYGNGTFTNYGEGTLTY